VVAHGAARQFSGNDVSYDIIGRTLEANYLVEGSVRRSGNSVRVTVSLIDPQNSTEVWSELYDRELTAEEYFSIQSDIVGRIAEALELAVTPDERVALAERPTEDIEAYNAYLQGRHHFSLFTGLADNRLAGQYLIHAIERDSTFALAYAALADLLAARGAAVGEESSTILELRGLEADDLTWPTAASFEPARRLALKALLLDSTLAEPHTTLGAIHFWYDWDWAAAGREFEEAIAISPDVAQGHQWYAEWLMAMNMPDSAVAEARLATELDPGSPVVHWSLVRMLTMARRNDEAKRVALAVVDSGDDPMMAMELAQIYLIDGSVDSALSWILEGMKRFGMPQHVLARQEALFDSVGVAAFAADLPPDPKVLSDEEFLRGLSFGAQGYAMAGRYEQALQVFERAHRLRLLSKTIPYVVRDPLLDPIRADPRFKAILVDMGLPDITED
jgi:tetratricopeptide (TPR) repeat protein